MIQAALGNSLLDIFPHFGITVQWVWTVFVKGCFPALVVTLLVKVYLHGQNET